MINDDKQASDIYDKSNFFDGMPNNLNKPPEEKIKTRAINIGERIKQDDKEYIVIATPEEPHGFIIPDKYYCVIKEVTTSKKFFFKL